MENERRIGERRRREEEGRRKGGENERRGRKGGVLGHAGFRNPGRRPRVPASSLIILLFQVINFYFNLLMDRSIYLLSPGFLHTFLVPTGTFDGDGGWRSWHWGERLGAWNMEIPPDSGHACRRVSKSWNVSCPHP